jgi:hypothetical protein
MPLRQTWLDRLKDLYMIGDMSKEAYLAERERVKQELAVLTVRDRGRNTQLGALAALPPGTRRYDPTIASGAIAVPPVADRGARDLVPLL